MASAEQSPCDIEHIALDLRFDWRKKSDAGQATINLSLLNPTDHDTLDSVELSIESVTDGKPLDFELSAVDGEDNLRISIGRVRKPSESISFVIKYRTNYVNIITHSLLSPEVAIHVAG